MVTISANNIHDRWRVDRDRDIRHSVRCVYCVCVVCSIDFSNVAKIVEDLNKGVPLLRQWGQHQRGTVCRVSVLTH